VLAGRIVAGATLVAITVVAAGCGGGSKPPSVASLGPASPTTTNNSGTPAPGGKPGPGSPDFVRFASCMQKHGIQVQIGSGGRGVSINIGDVRGGPNSPTFRAAQQACQKYLPDGGPKQLTPAQIAAEMPKLVALSKCMRAHGVPNFPDPSSDGSFSLSANGTLDPKSSTFQAAMQTCGSQGKGNVRIGIRVHP